MKIIAEETALSTEKLLRRGGKDSIYVILVKGEYMQSSPCFSRRFLLVS